MTRSGSLLIENWTQAKAIGIPVELFDFATEHRCPDCTAVGGSLWVTEELPPGAAYAGGIATLEVTHDENCPRVATPWAALGTYESTVTDGHPKDHHHDDS